MNSCIICRLGPVSGVLSSLRHSRGGATRVRGAASLETMKARRQTAILDLIAERDVTSQEQLRELLKSRGIGTTQATLSRDIRDLGLVKSAADGAYRLSPVRPAELDSEGAVRRAIDEYLRTLRAGRAAPGPQDESRSGAGARDCAGSVRPAGCRRDDSGRRHHPRDLPIRGARRGVCRSADRLETRTAAGGAGALGRCRAGLSSPADAGSEDPALHPGRHARTA